MIAGCRCPAQTQAITLTIPVVARSRLIVDLAVRQHLLEFRHAVVGNSRSPDVELCEVVQPLEVLQAGIGDAGTFEVQRRGVGSAP